MSLFRDNKYKKGREGGDEEEREGEGKGGRKEGREGSRDGERKAGLEGGDREQLNEKEDHIYLNTFN